MSVVELESKPIVSGECVQILGTILTYEHHGIVLYALHYLQPHNTVRYPLFPIGNCECESRVCGGAREQADCFRRTIQCDSLYFLLETVNANPVSVVELESKPIVSAAQYSAISSISYGNCECESRVCGGAQEQADCFRRTIQCDIHYFLLETVNANPVSVVELESKPIVSGECVQIFGIFTYEHYGTVLYLCITCSHTIQCYILYFLLETVNANPVSVVELESKPIVSGECVQILGIFTYEHHGIVLYALHYLQPHNTVRYPLFPIGNCECESRVCCGAREQADCFR
ncbi:hypothetical protein J6590_013571 [Homalodisca vitripennis]|nr:hypothetical protein J6590_013571 [Homalodisca vitripennis]